MKDIEDNTRYYFNQKTLFLIMSLVTFPARLIEILYKYKDHRLIILTF